jgi:hypothetical protein
MEKEKKEILNEIFHGFSEPNQKATSYCLKGGHGLSFPHVPSLSLFTVILPYHVYIARVVDRSH